MVVGHVRVERCAVGPDLHAEDPVAVLHVGEEPVGQAPLSPRVAEATSRAAASSASRRPGAAVASPITISTAQSSIRASCWLISRGLESPAIFCRNGVWSKTKSRSGRSGARGVVEDLAEHLGHAGPACGVRLARVLVGLQRPPHRGEVGEVDAARARGRRSSRPRWTCRRRRPRRARWRARRRRPGWCAPSTTASAACGRAAPSAARSAASVAAISAGERAGNSAAELGGRALRSAGAGASGSVAVSTHHWCPSRPLLRIEVQLPWTSCGCGRGRTCSARCRTPRRR